MVNEELPISSARDLSPLYEAFTEEDDEDGNPIFDYSSFGCTTMELRWIRFKIGWKG
jgi:hypothetical protein